MRLSGSTDGHAQAGIAPLAAAAAAASSLALVPPRRPSCCTARGTLWAALQKASLQAGLEH